MEPTTTEPCSSPAARSGHEVDRRTVLTGLAGLGGLIASVTTAQAQSNSTTNANLRLLQRATYGPTTADVQEISRLGTSNWLERQMAMTEQDDRACEDGVRKLWPRVHMNAAQLSDVNDDWITSINLQDATFYRMVNSKRQLYQRMVEFWREHFSMYIWKVGGAKFVDEHNSVIRRFALGKFSDLLWGSAHSAAMGEYLDNAWSGWWAPNQNYAREIMELHTLSVTGGYTQNDVENVTRAFTGWSYEWDHNSPRHNYFVYRSDWHDNDPKTFLGRTVPSGLGKRDGETVLSLLVMHPNTARFIARKLTQWFLGEGSWGPIETQVVNAYMRTGGDVKAMLRVLLTPANLLKAKPKLKRPAHLYASAVRPLAGRISRLDWTRWGYINQAGHELFAWAPPDGYPDKNAYWSGLLLPRWNFMMVLMANWMNEEIAYDLFRVVGQPANARQLCDRINTVFFQGVMPPVEYQRLLQFASAHRLDEWQIRSTVCLALCAPSFQWM